MLKKRLMLQVLGKFLFETIAVVIGISIAFLVEEWKEERWERKEEAQLLTAIRSDILNNRTTLNQFIATIDVHMATYQRILDKGWQADSVVFDIDRLNTYIAYRPIDLAFKELQQTGKSNLIRNRSLLTQIINLNDRHIRLIDESVSIDKQFILDRMIPFLETHVNYPYDSQLDVKLLGDNHFRNLVKTNITFKTIDKMALQAYQRNADKLLTAIDKELASRKTGQPPEKTPPPR